ncbi:signal peptidase I [Robertmurraya sp. P23]|uniref:signal peptidase I n=1 Tax=Robertmurraya sp. P23 TaxID=3436931 RepID=UPI003D999FAE
MGETKKSQEIISWGKSVFIAFAIVVVVRTFVFAPYIVDGASMEPTLHDQEKIFVNKVNTDKIEREDIVIIKGEGENYVKRIIGLPGDMIEIREDQLLINGVVHSEEYLESNREQAHEQGSVLTGDYGPTLVPEGHYFVLGDNRLRSMDSRNGLGFIKKEKIVGVSEFVFYPFSDVREVQ